VEAARRLVEAADAPRIDSIVPNTGYPDERVTVRIYGVSLVGAGFKVGVMPEHPTAYHGQSPSVRSITDREVRIGRTIRSPLTLVADGGCLQADIQIPADEPRGEREVAILVNGEPLGPRGSFTVLGQAEPDIALSDAHARVDRSGETLFTGAQVRNIGKGASSVANLRIFCGAAGDPKHLKVPALKPGGRWEANQTLKLMPDSRKPVDTVFFTVESRGDGEGSNNQAMAEFQLVLPRPDLRVAGLSPEYDVGNNRMTLHVNIANDGDAASSTVTLSIRTSAPALPGRTETSTAVAPHTAVDKQVQFHVPANLWGTRVRFDVEALPSESEVELDNNRLSTELVLPVPGAPPRPNLALAAPGWAYEESARTLSFWVTVRNLGDADAGPATLEMSAAGTGLAGRAEVPPLRKHDASVCTLRVAVPKGVTGEMELVARVVPDRSTGDSDPADNTVSVAARIRVTAAAPAAPILPYVLGGGAAAVVAAWAALRGIARRGRGPRTARTPPPEARPEEPKMAEPPTEAAAGAAGVLGKKKPDQVYFTVTAPAAVAPKARFIVNLWAHLEAQRKEVLKRAREARPDTRLTAATEGALAIEPDTDLDVRLEIDDCSVEPGQKTIHWTGAIAGAGFVATVNEGAAEGEKVGTAFVYVNGIERASVPFMLKVGREATADESILASARAYEKAFASYAHEDVDEVLLIIRGLQHDCPHLTIIQDEAAASSGRIMWAKLLEEQILACDVLYLFWSREAAKSEWVNKEWRFGFEKKGRRFIDPLPLDRTDPPQELGPWQFKDKWRTLRAGVIAEREKAEKTG